MTLLCFKCGNHSKFMKYANYTEFSTEEHICDGEGEMYDVGESEVNDSEFKDYDPEIKCLHCKYTCGMGDDEIADLDETEHLIARAKHTDEKGFWHEEKLEKPNKQLMLKAGAKSI